MVTVEVVPLPVSVEIAIPALAEIAAASERQAQVLAQAIGQAMRAAAQPATAEAPRQITHWTFDVERDERGNLTRVTAQAGMPAGTIQ